MNKNYFNFNKKISLKPRCHRDIGETSWFCGFSERHGSFQLRYTPKTENRKRSRFACSYELTQSNCGLEFMEKIATFLEIKGGVKVIKRKRPNLPLRLRTSSVKSNQLLRGYFKKYPLKSSKHLEFCD